MGRMSKMRRLLRGSGESGTGEVYSEMMDDLEITAEEGMDEVVVEFVE